MKKEIPIFHLINNYKYWLSLNFTLIVKGARLTPERLTKIIITDIMTFQKKDLLTEILYKREVVLL